MDSSSKKLQALKRTVAARSSSKNFIHSEWYVIYHLKIVEQIATELLQHYPQADPEMVSIMVWLHDYGKTYAFDGQYDLTLSNGRKLLTQLGYEVSYVNKIIRNLEVLDNKLEINLREAPVEVQIASSADGCSHFVGPFMHFWWKENHEKTGKQLMNDNHSKAIKDWNRKIVLPEARRAFELRYSIVLENTGILPEKFI